MYCKRMLILRFMDVLDILRMSKKESHMLIAMCGCMMYEPDVVEKIRDSYKFVDIVLVHINTYTQWQKLIYMLRITSGSGY